MPRSPLFTRKPSWMLYEEMKGENRLRRVLGPVQLTSLGSRRDHRHRHLRAHRGGRPRQGRARAHALLRGGRAGLHLRRPVLRGVRLDGPRGRLRLHLRLRHPRRAVRVDHRLGPDPRVRRRLDDGRPRLVQDTSRTSSPSLGLHVPHALRPTRPSTSTPRLGCIVATGSFIDLPAMLIAAVVTVILVIGIQRERRLQHRHGGHQGRDRAVRHRRRRLLRQPGELASLRALRLHRAELLRTHPVGPDGTGGAPARHARRRRGDLLRLHRLRFRLHPRRGGPEAQQRTCPIGIIVLAHPVHRPLHRRRRRPHRHGSATTRSTSRRRSPTPSARPACPGPGAS